MEKELIGNGEYLLTAIMKLGDTQEAFEKAYNSIISQPVINNRIQIILLGENTKPLVAKYAENADCEKYEVLYAQCLDDAKTQVRGKYICLSNGKDYWSENALVKLCEFLDVNGKEVDIVYGKCRDIEKTDAILKLSEERILNLDSAYRKGRICLNNAVFKRKCLDEIECYEGTAGEESAIASAKILMKKKQYGLLEEAVLWCESNEIHKLSSISADCCRKLVEISCSCCGSVIPYIQHLIMNPLLIAFKNRTDKELLEEYLQYIDDAFLSVQKDLSTAEIQYLYNLKYKKNVLSEAVGDENGKFFYNDRSIFSVNARHRILVKIISLDWKNEKIVFEGYTDLNLLGNDIEVYMQDNEGNPYMVDLIPFPLKDEKGYGEELCLIGMRFYAEVPLKSGKSFSFKVKEERRAFDLPVGITMGAFSKLNSEANHSYFVERDYIVCYSNRRIVISKYGLLRHVGKEFKYLVELIGKKKYSIAAYRILFRLDKLFSSKKPVWIVTDRPHVAKDNGEHFFRYLMNSEAKDKYDIYFMLKKDSPDFERVSKYGRILIHDSFKHKMKFLQADKIISSAGNNLAINAFGNKRRYYHDLYKFDFVYLRHGVSHNDQSRWLNRLDKNIRILDSTSKREYDAILKGNYLYDESRVKLTGLPRYDNLFNESKKMITFMPTWRKNLEADLMPRSSRRKYIDDFTETEYYQFYNNLINDERLLKTMKEYGYRGSFYVHPVFEQQAGDFISNELITVGLELADYQQIFKESDLMITDYSSVAFDFAYLKKPVIYTQFDAASFYENHTWGKGYFTYKEDGFGPVIYDYEIAVETIIQYIRNGCRMEEEYVQKVEDFFAYTDRNNCKRVYEAIREIDNSCM